MWSRRTGVSAVVVYWSVAVTIVNVCCAYWSGVSGRGECTDHTVRMYARLSVHGCCVSLWRSWLSSYSYVSPEVYLYRPPTSSTESIRFPSALVVRSKTWISSPLDAICTEQTSAPAFIGNHDARVVALRSWLWLLIFVPQHYSHTKGGCGESSRICCSRCG